MVISVVVMLATGAKFVPVMAAPVVFLGVGVLMYRSGRKAAQASGLPHRRPYPTPASSSMRR
ncbi:hypothetical protein ACH489_16175 [Streptomyces rubiginosohelvolus]